MPNVLKWAKSQCDEFWNSFQNNGIVREILSTLSIEDESNSTSISLHLDGITYNNKTISWDRIFNAIEKIE